LIRRLAIVMLLLLVGTTRALAVTRDEIPPDLVRRLPEFLLYIVDPQALAALSLADLEEYASAYDRGELRFVNEVRIVQSGGPVSEELAALILQVPQGAPYIESRFVRLAKAAYGRGVFSMLRWEVLLNSDDSVDIQLWYRSNDPENYIPDPGYSSLAGWLYGVRYDHQYYGGEDKQLAYGLQWSGEDPVEPKLSASYSDNTVENGLSTFSVSASTSNEWRQRLRSSEENIANIRDRTTRVDALYSWNDDVKLGSKNFGWGVGGGIYHNDHFVIGGDPTGGPRGDVDQSGTAAYASLFMFSGRRDLRFTPRDGWSYNLRLEQHAGAFPFTRFSTDLRQYYPMDNPLGIEVAEADSAGGTNDIRQFFPAASLGVQVQASIADGDVPYSEELRPGSSTNVRGYEYDDVVATKLLGARAEYRFALDQNRDYEAFIFSDHAVYGESLDNMESLNSYGVGALLKLPIYGGFKIGAYNAWSYDGTETNWGLAFGYQF
jgi:hypothetical protein